LSQTGVMSDTSPPQTLRSHSTVPGLSLEEQVAALAQSPLFRSVELAQLRLLAFSAEDRVVEAGTVIAAPDGLDAPAYLVCGGTLRVGEQTVGAGAVINAAGAMSHAPLSCRIEAVTQSRLLLIAPDLVSRLIGEYPEMGRAMLRSLGQDLRGLARQMRLHADAAARAATDTAQPASST